MAEHFYGKNHTLHTSNKGGEELLKGLIGVSNKLQETTSIIKVRFFLENQLKQGSGWKAFSLNPNIDYPELFENTNNLITLINIIKHFGNELTKTQPKLDCDIDWTRDLRCKWLAKTLELHEIIRQLLFDRKICIDKLNYNIDNDDSNLCQYYLISDYYYELCRRYKKNKPENEEENKINETKLKYLDKIISIIEIGIQQNDILLIYLLERAELLISIGNKEEAILDLKKCFILEDENGNKAILDHLKELNKETDNQLE
ncbi:hypothetical protein [Aquimarina algiphila]|uniref:hypothetical protein n=1 Tax=Aquimarina algiphila TaxID=2047982 RepID=UPI00232F5C1A|nr:hypothetical protein [Aquimarina algiphila]